MDKELFFDKNGKAWPVGPSFKDVPNSARVIRCPLCRVCKNEYVTDEYKLKCKTKGDIPYELDMGESFQCEFFDADKNALNYEVVMKEINRSE